MNRNVKKVSQLSACNTPQPADLLILSGNNNANSFKLSLTKLFDNITISTNVPANSSSDGLAGTTAYDDTYFYICVSENVWRRIPHETF